MDLPSFEEYRRILTESARQDRPPTFKELVESNEELAEAFGDILNYFGLRKSKKSPDKKRPVTLPPLPGTSVGVEDDAYADSWDSLTANKDFKRPSPPPLPSVPQAPGKKIHGTDGDEWYGLNPDMNGKLGKRWKIPPRFPSTGVSRADRVARREAGRAKMGSARHTPPPIRESDKFRAKWQDHLSAPKSLWPDEMRWHFDYMSPEEQFAVLPAHAGDAGQRALETARRRLGRVYMDPKRRDQAVDNWRSSRSEESKRLRGSIEDSMRGADRIAAATRPYPVDAVEEPAPPVPPVPRRRGGRKKKEPSAETDL